jgi:leader peptidase (prepilin peptidase)/N-methyltransferase
MHGYFEVTGLIFLFGLAVGSFLNVLIYRLPRGKKIVLERSACPHCSHQIPFYHNIPVLSFILLRGKCQNCRKRISWRYPLVELINASLFLLFFYVDGLTWHLPFHMFLMSALVTIFFIDLEFQIIPDKITLPGIAIGLFGAIVAPPPGIVQALIGTVVGGGGLLLVAYFGEWLFKKEAMGGGDIKMAAMMGAFVGWQKVLLIFMGGAFIGMVVSLVWMALSKKLRQERLIPFGPFLALAAVMAVVYGDQIIRFYLGTFLR